MFAFPHPFVALQRQSLESAQAIAMASFAGFEKLTELNVQAAKASVEESVQAGISLLETRDAKALAETFSASAQPIGSKFAAYARHVHEITNETTAEISRVVENHFNEGNRQLVASIEALASNSPVGAEGMTTLVKSAVSAANATWDQVTKVKQQIAETTEASLVNAINAEDTIDQRTTA